MKNVLQKDKFILCAKLIREAEGAARSYFSPITDGNLEMAATEALSILIQRSLEEGVEEDVFAFMLHYLKTDSLAYMAVFGFLELDYGKLLPEERRVFAERMANFYYTAAFSNLSIEEIDERLKDIFSPIYSRLGIDFSKF